MMDIQSILEYIYVNHSNKCPPYLQKIGSSTRDIYYSKLIKFVELLKFHTSTRFRLDARNIYSELINSYEEIICNIDFFQEAFDITAMIRKAVSVGVSNCFVLELTAEEALRYIIRDIKAMDINISTDINCIKQKSFYDFADSEIFLLFDLPLFANAMSLFYNPLISNDPLEKKSTKIILFKLAIVTFILVLVLVALIT